MRAFVTRFEAAYVEAGQALKEACRDVEPEKFLHHLVRGILLMEAVQLDVSEQNAVLATSGRTGNSWLFDDIKEALQLQWSDDAVIRRDRMQKGRRAQANAIESHTWELEQLRNALDATEEPEDFHDGSWDEQAADYEAVDDEDEGPDYEEPGELEEPHDEEVAMAADSILEQFGGNTDDAEAFAFEEASRAARTFQEARRLLTEVRGSRGY